MKNINICYIEQYKFTCMYSLDWNLDIKNGGMFVIKHHFENNNLVRR